MRKLATIRTIDDIQPIDGADAIDVATVGGWNVVVKKGEHTVGESVVFCEIDSWLPFAVAPFLCDVDRPKEFEGVVGARLRTKKLRGIVSQGLILPISVVMGDVFHFDEDEDVTDRLGILKYEKPVSAQLQGMARGNFPTFIPKTDQERIQNCKKDLHDWVERALTFEVSEKLDGSSCTIYGVSEESEDGSSLVYRIGVCSRNLDLKETEGNTFWSTARSSGAYDALVKSGVNYAIQGEVIGNGIQGNQYKLTGADFYVFDIYDINARKYLSSAERMAFCDAHKLKHAPVVHDVFKVDVHDIQALLKMADGASHLNQSNREGLVFKCIEIPEISFKAISNKWLLKNEE